MGIIPANLNQSRLELMPIYTLPLKARKTVAHQTIELCFEKPEGFSYVAGQYGGFTLMNPDVTDEKGNTRRFSLLSAPHETQLRIVTRLQTSAYKKNLETMALNAAIKFAGPTGNFVLHDDVKQAAVFLAGGIGIAPFYSMIQTALRETPARKLTLFYGNQRLADAAYVEELTALTKQYANFKMIVVLANPEADWTGETGFITDELLVKYAPDYEASIIYACGSPGMVSAMQVMLAELEMNPEQLRFEDFPGY